MEQTIIDHWRTQRDQKLRAMLNPDEPAWLVSEEIDFPKEVVRYAIVHRWGADGWAIRRYTYDIVADVIHFRGTSPVSDGEISKLKPEQRIIHS